MSIMLCNAILTNRYIGTNSLFVLGGSFTSPFIFIFGDVIAEIFGYKTTRFVIFSGFACQTIFVLVCQLVVASPHPTFLTSDAEQAYSSILGSSLFWINLSGFTAYMIANLVNAKIISKWKILLKGKHFWLRSLGASTFSEALYTFIAIVMMELNSIPLINMLKVIVISFIIKLVYSSFFAAPANLLVSYVKKHTGIDVYDLPTSYTPFKYVEAHAEQQGK
jgi:uncharacterized integral membrane protein (TIGR00697 family)